MTLVGFLSAMPVDGMVLVGLGGSRFATVLMTLVGFWIVMPVDGMVLVGLGGS